MTASTICSDTDFGSGTVILPKPMYTSGLPSRLAFSIKRMSESAGFQSKSGLSRNQLQRTLAPAGVLGKVVHLLARDDHSISPVNRLGHDRRREVINKSNLRLCEMIHVRAVKLQCAFPPSINLAGGRHPEHIVEQRVSGTMVISKYGAKEQQR